MPVPRETEIVEAHLDTFGKRLRAARLGFYERTGKDLSQVELSAKVGMTKGAVSSWEADSYLPPVETIELLAGELGVTPGWLAFGQEPREAPFRVPYRKPAKAPVRRVAESKRRGKD